tara:strand:- start:4335 stop:5159 length:825 start_codon:yes stop_codon:yes gene_type:complete
MSTRKNPWNTYQRENKIEKLAKDVLETRCKEACIEKCEGKGRQCKTKCGLQVQFAACQYQQKKKKAQEVKVARALEVKKFPSVDDVKKQVKKLQLNDTARYEYVAYICKLAWTAKYLFDYEPANEIENLLEDSFSRYPLPQRPSRRYNEWPNTREYQEQVDKYIHQVNKSGNSVGFLRELIGNKEKEIQKMWEQSKWLGEVPSAAQMWGSEKGNQAWATNFPRQSKATIKIYEQKRADVEIELQLQNMQLDALSVTALHLGLNTALRTGNLSDV